MRRLSDPEVWREIIAALRASPVRTGLTMAGVCWATFMLILMLGFSSGLEQGAMQAVRGTVTNAVYVWGGRTRLPFKGRSPGWRVVYDNDDVAPLRALPGVDLLAPRNQLGGYRDGTPVVRGIESGAFQIMGDYPVYRDIMPLAWDSGRFINDLDIARNRKVAVLGRQVVETLWPDGGEPLGAWVAIRGVQFQVVGTFHSEAGDDGGDRAEQTIHVPFTTFQRAFNVPNQVQWFAITGYDHVSGSQLEADVKALLRHRHGVHPEDTQALGSYNSEVEFSRVRKLFTGIRGLTWLVGIATLLTGAVGVSNVLLIVVRERTREIGVRRAMGATPWSIVAMVLQESLVMTGIAGAVGLFGGLLVLQMAGALIGPDNPSFGVPRIQPLSAITAVILLAIAGIVAGLLPAQRAVAIQPVDALRSE